jgi:hypothetical protein
MKLFHHIFVVYNVVDVVYTDDFGTSCPWHLDLPGTCLNSRACGVDFNSMFGVGAMVQECTCVDLQKICIASHVVLDVMWYWNGQEDNFTFKTF